MPVGEAFEVARPAFSAARLAGLPERDPPPLPLAPFLPRLLDAPGLPMGPMPGMFGVPPRATVFIIFAACSNRCTSWLTSVTVMPEPLAMRIRREPLRIFGLRRSPGVIERMMASVRSISRSSKSSSCCFIWPMPGSMPSIFFIEPIFFIC